MANYNIENVYQGGYSSFTPNYGDVFTGYRVPASSLGAPTNPFTANQIAEVNKLLSQGIVPIEIGTIKPEDFEAIPRQHFKEIKQMAKLTGAKVSLHSPLIEASGVAEGGWSEANRQAAEYQLNDVVEKAHELDARGNIPITIHSANIPGTEYKITPEGKKIEKLGAINQETGQMTAVKEKIKYYPEPMMELKPGIKEKILRGEIKERKREHFREIPFEKGKIISPEDQINILNHSEWDNSISQLLFNKERADEIVRQNSPQISHLLQELAEKKMNDKELKEFLSKEENAVQRRAYNHLTNAETYLEDVNEHLSSLFSKAYEYGSPEQKKDLTEIRNQYQKQLSKIHPNDIMAKSEAVQNLMHELKTPELAPSVYVPVTEFAMKKSAETFGNIAFNSFKKFGEKAPVISIENLYPGYAFSTGKEMNDLILASKKQFVENATKNGHSKSEAEKYADKLIGLTFDVGHLNIHRKHGFSEEDLKKEFEAMSKHIKHVHLTDNFGSYDSHLPPGMGNVPFKQYFEELKKKGYTGETIVEAGGFAKSFERSPYPISPYYGNPGSYSSGYGEILPGIHYETFGAGFSNLPQEFGGTRGRGGEGSRMGGRGME
ncbi:sugar phosphate isomerase/epimerase [Candidatus Pacearchaeota archaeon]|nr:sugar phosphate isomerase/epimerase [Candidatus Pacearchaeota archaeon]